VNPQAAAGGEQQEQGGAQPPAPAPEEPADTSDLTYETYFRGQVPGPSIEDRRVRPPRDEADG
jgi:hypothetical protein